MLTALVMELGFCYSLWQLVPPRQRFLPPWLLAALLLMAWDPILALWLPVVLLPPTYRVAKQCSPRTGGWLIGLAWSTGLLPLVAALGKFCRLEALYLGIAGVQLLLAPLFFILLFRSTLRAIDRLKSALPASDAAGPAAEIVRLRRKECRRITLYAMIAMLTIPLLSYAGFCAVQYRKIPQKYRELEKDGFFFDVSELYARYPASPASDQAVFAELNRLQAGIDPNLFGSPDIDSAALSPEMRQKLDEAIATHAGIDTALDRWLAIPDWMWENRWEDGFTMMLPHLSVLRSLGRYCAVAADRAIDRGDIGAFQAFDRRMRGLSERAGADDILISHIVARSLEIMRLNTFARLAARGDLKYFDAAMLREEIAYSRQTEARFAAQLRRSIHMDACFAADAGTDGKKFAEAIEDPDTNRTIFRLLPLYLYTHHGIKDRIFFFDKMQSYAENAGLDFYRVELPDDSETGGENRYLFSSALLPAGKALFQKNAGLSAAERTFRTAMALELYRRKYHRLPDQLDALVPAFLDAVPIDPFDGKPLRYRIGEQRVNRATLPAEPEGNAQNITLTFYGFAVYSVGPDLKDDGGNPGDPGTDWNPQNMVFAVKTPKNP